MKIPRILAPATCLFMALPGWADTAITYQGQLQSADEPITETLTMDFQLFEDPVEDLVFSSMVTEDVDVIGGLFQVELDFGASYRPGLWLEITVEGETLSPRQQLTAAPLAVRSLDSFWEPVPNSSNIRYPDGQVRIGTASGQARLVLGTVEEEDALRIMGPGSSGGQSGYLIVGANRGTTIGALVEAPDAGLLVAGQSRLINNVLMENRLGIGTDNPASQFHLAGEDVNVFMGDFAGGGFSAAFQSDGSTVFLGGPEDSQSAFFIGDPVVLGSNTDFRMSADATIGRSVSIGDPQFDPGPGGLRAEGIIVAEGDFLATFGELQMATASMPGGANSVCRSTTGSFQVLGFCSSSLRFKSRVRDLDAASDVVERLRAVSFRWNDTGREDIGLIAEEVAEVEPRLATRGEDGEILGVNYRHLGALLVKAVQEQRAELATRDAHIARLEAELEAQRNDTVERLAAIEAVLTHGEHLAGSD